ncbi:MAG: TRAM domain-containing protein, partial [Bacteroidota bacterium]
KGAGRLRINAPKIVEQAQPELDESCGSVDLIQRRPERIARSCSRRTHGVLVEGPSKRKAAQWKGRTDTNKTVIFPHEDVRGYVIGDIVNVTIESSSSATLVGKLV